MVLVLTMVVLQSISFANYALTTKTTNIIYGSAPYLTFDGGRTRVTNTESLLGISLSDGRAFTPTTNNSSSRNPIVLPVAGQSFNDIGMLVPTDTNSIALSSLIGTPYNYWGDDDGDGQGIDGITATGSLKVSIYDKNGRAVARNKILTFCGDKAPYILILSNTSGRLTTRYGVPNESRFSGGRVYYYINPKRESSPVICFAKPGITYYISGGLSDAIWEYDKGFLPQSFTPSSYGLNFPTTGANNLVFALEIGGNNQALSWAPVSHGGITATMTDSTSTSVRVTLTGPVATESQWQSQYPGRIDKPSLPQTFELVGRDSSGNAVVKYGFVLKQWFIHSGTYRNTQSIISSKCNSFGYRLPKIRDLTNARCVYLPGTLGGTGCRGAVGATPSSPTNISRRHIGAGFITEWGRLDRYPDANFNTQHFFRTVYWTQDRAAGGRFFLVYSWEGEIHERLPSDLDDSYGICTYP